MTSAGAFRRQITAVLCALFFLLRSIAFAAAEAAPARIEKITFRGNRTAEKILRRRLPFSEGGVLVPGALKAARDSLWDMRQFKSVQVSSSSLPDGGAAVDIAVEDGWFVVPIPFLAGGSGGGRGGLFLFSGNVFKRAESVMASGLSGSAGSSAMLSLRREGWSLKAASARRDLTERRYADGAFTSGSGYGPPSDERDTAAYGPVAASYRKLSDETAFSAGFPLSSGYGRLPALTASMGWERRALRYSDPSPSAPRDAGRQGQAFVSLRTGRGGGEGDGVGAIFGFGLADMERRLAPLPAPVYGSSAQFAYYRGDPRTGSSFDYGYCLVRLDGTLTWGSHRTLSLRFAGGSGEGMPPGRLLATGRETGLSGSYAREFRGLSAAGANLAYSHPFRITRRGIWQGMVFAETAGTWGGDAGAKTGAGASFWYKFWRFPLPLGFSCTYSFDDREPQFSAALGGRF